MVVRVVTDSGADIPQQIVSDLGITVVPLTVSFGGDSFVDQVELVDGAIENGDWILSYNGSVLSGIRQWQGKMIDIPVMGYSENDANTSDYLSEGDIPTFKIYDSSAEEFYERLVKEEMMPTTSQPSIGSFVDVYKKIKKSSDQILSIHVSSKLSGTLNSATQAASEEELGESIDIACVELISLNCCFPVFKYKVVLLNVVNSSCLSNVLCFVQKSD